MAAGESRNRTSLPNKLMRLQLVGGYRTPFAAVPPSCQVPIECVLDEPAGDLQSEQAVCCIFVGKKWVGGVVGVEMGWLVQGGSLLASSLGKQKH